MIRTSALSTKTPPSTIDGNYPVPISGVVGHFRQDSDTTVTELAVGHSPAAVHTDSHVKQTQPSVLTDKYGLTLLIGKQIGKGGFSRCYTATTLSGKVFAVKTISREPSLRKVTRAHIEREALIHSNLSHPSIVKLMEVIADDKRLSLILDYCPNNTLFELVSSVGRIPEPAARAILKPVFEAVQYLHERLIHHGDLKLSNIFLDSKWNPKVGDFGFSKQLTSANQVRRRLCGTPAYMAPELIMRPCKFGLPADIWSLGVITYALLYGVTAFDAKQVDEVYARILMYDLRFPSSIEVSAETVHLIKWMLCRRPEGRPTARLLVESGLKEDALARTDTSSSGSSDGGTRESAHKASKVKRAGLQVARKIAELKTAVKQKLRKLKRMRKQHAKTPPPCSAYTNIT